MSNNTRGTPRFTASGSSQQATRKTGAGRVPCRDGEEFIRAIQDVLDSSDPLATYEAIIVQLETGCESYPTSDQVARIADLLKDRLEAARLAADLGLRVRLRPRLTLARAVYARLLPALEKQVEFPPRVSGNAEPGQQAERDVHLLTWFDSFERKSAIARRSDVKSSTPLPGLQEYAALACFLQEPQVPTNLIYRLLDLVAEPPGRQVASRSGLAEETAGLLRQVQRELFKPSSVRKRLRAGLDWAGPARKRTAELTKEAAMLNDRLQWRAQAYAEQQERYQVCQAAELAARQRIAELEGSLTEALSKADRAAERLQEREDHWQITASNQLARVLSTFREQLRHELDEALTALNADSQHLEIAVRRLQRARAIVAEMEP